MKLKHAYLLSLLIAGLFCVVASLQAQTPAGDSTKGESEPKVHEKTLWVTVKQGGIVMIPIAACSILTFYLCVDGWMRTKLSRVMPETHLTAVRNAFRQGDYVGAYNYCKANASPFTNVCRVTVSSLGDGKQVTEEGMIGELTKENSQINSWISYLSVIGVCTPMIGLLGTVTGMIKAFDTLGSSGIGDPSKLSGAIGEVLVATASGLFIAIPAFIGYYVLRNRAIKAIHDIQDTMAGLLRKMPYDHLAGAHIGDDELYAAVPNWVGHEEQQPHRQEPPHP